VNAPALKSIHRQTIIKASANWLLARSGEDKTVGPNWVYRFYDSLAVDRFQASSDSNQLINAFSCI
jgi:hypothetical protein